MSNWLKDHRQELDSDIWAMPPLYHRIWQYLKYKANFKEAVIPMKDGTKLTVTPGQHLTSIRNIAHGVAWHEYGVRREPNPKTVSGVLKWLENEGMITVENGNRKYTLITIVKWGFYQCNECEEVTTGKQQMDIKKNNKEREETKNNKLKPSSRNTKTYSEDSDSYKLASYLFEQIKESKRKRGLTFKGKTPNLQNWADDIRKLMDIDGADAQLVKDVINFATNDAFWSGNILSAANLRKHFEKLEGKMRATKPGRRERNDLAFINDL